MTQFEETIPTFINEASLQPLEGPSGLPVEKISTPKRPRRVSSKNKVYASIQNSGKSSPRLKDNKSKNKNSNISLG